MSPSETSRPNQRVPRSQIGKVIAVASTKGGVGKSFVTGLLACELSRMGQRVGILDADLIGSSITRLFGVSNPVTPGQYNVSPLVCRSGILTMSPNQIVDDESQVIIWKEGLAGKAIEELFYEVEWGPVDTMLIDLPAATSEMAVSILKALPVDGVLIVTQPQEITGRIAAKAVRAVQTMGIHILGIVENMAYLTLNESERSFPLFGESHADELAARANSQVMARIPLQPEIVRLCDAGRIEDVMLPAGAELAAAVDQAIRDLAQQVEIDSTPEPTPAAEEAAEDAPICDSGIDSESMEYTHTGDTLSPVVIELIRNQDNLGSLDRPDAQGYFIGSCGDKMQIDLRIVNGRILRAQFIPEGCGVTLACGSMVTKMACARTLEEAQSIRPEDVVAAVGGLPDDHLHCAELAVMTLREAVIDAQEGHLMR